MTPTVRVFAPATVANVTCGFDILGFAVEGPGDLVTARCKSSPGIEIEAITGDDGRLPRDPAANTASIAAQALLDAMGRRDGVALSLDKRMPLESGLGSSAASAVAGAFATAVLLGIDASRDLLLRCALEAEAVACGSAHADNAAPCLWGGLTLVRDGEVVALPIPDGLCCALVRPHVGVATGSSRTLLGDTVPRAAAVGQAAHLGALVAGLFQGDLDLVSRSLVDHLAEPLRGPHVPGFLPARAAARAAGALGAGLAGSGPTVFALCRDAAEAARVVEAMRTAAADDTGLAVDHWVSPLGGAGVRRVDDDI